MITKIIITQKTVQPRTLRQNVHKFFVENLTWFERLRSTYSKIFRRFTNSARVSCPVFLSFSSPFPLLYKAQSTIPWITVSSPSRVPLLLAESCSSSLSPSAWASLPAPCPVTLPPSGPVPISPGPVPCSRLDPTPHSWPGPPTVLAQSLCLDCQA
jgi:hypothetical protein